MSWSLAGREDFSSNVCDISAKSVTASHVAVRRHDSDDSETRLPRSTRQRESFTWLSRSKSGRPGCQSNGWKPLSLTRPILGAIAVLSLLIAAAIETLAVRSQADGGLALSPTLDDIPTYAMVSYLYAPNIVAVLYSLIWSWVDLDAKRMQPWFELSKPSGATAENSIFLDYPYEFVAVVPFKAFKRKYVFWCSVWSRS